MVCVGKAIPMGHGIGANASKTANYTGMQFYSGAQMAAGARHPSGSSCRMCRTRHAHSHFILC